MLDDKPFTMPEPSPGMPVLWYRQGIKEGRKAEIAFVLSVGNRSIRARTAYGELQETVRHIADPKLKENRDQRENGGWDFTDDHYARAAWTADVENKLQAIESRLSKLLIDSARQSDADSQDNYRSLLQEARNLGCEFRGNPSRKKLEQMIREVQLNAESSAVTGGESVAGEDRAGEEG